MSDGNINKKEGQPSQKTATAGDWHNLTDMSEDYEQLALDITFDVHQMDNLRLGFIPVDMNQKWFMYFYNDTLHIHRSWTGFKMFEVIFEPGSGAYLASSARVNMDPEFYSGTLEEARENLLWLLGCFANDEAHQPEEESFLSSLTEATRSNYLGSPQVIDELTNPLFWGALYQGFPKFISNYQSIQEFQKTGYQDLIDTALVRTWA